jgi:alcohol dehydrogenase (cytochrome c)
MGDARPGDNLFTNIALDPDTGALQGHHQYHWNGSWNWDEVTPPLIDIERGGRTIPSLVHVGKNGYVWWLEQEPARISFVDASPYVYQNVFASVDPQTGRPTYDPARVPGTGKRATFCPSVAGAKNWQPEAYNPRTGLLYIPATENLCSVMEGTEVEYVPGKRFSGANVNVFRADGADHLTELQAWNVETGDMVWTRELEPRNGGSVLTTGGDLVFLGGQSDRFRAYSARSGDVLWEIRVNSGRTGVPTSYAVDGVQYIAVQTGAEPAPRAGDSGSESQGAFGFPQDGVVWVFALDCQC